MLIILLEDNGDYYLKKRTLKSLEKQDKTLYKVYIYPEKNRKKIWRKILDYRNNYYMFLQSGMEILPNAIKIISKLINKTHAAWYYGNEQIWKEYEKKDFFEDKLKPNFGVFGFVSCLYTGCAVIFLGEILKKLSFKESIDEYKIFLLKKTIEVAENYDGYHIDFPLLSRKRFSNFTEEQGLILNNCLNKLLYQRKLPFVAVVNGEEGFSRLYKVNSNKYTSTIIVISDNSKKDQFWKKVYNNIAGKRKVIISAGEKSIGNKWNCAAEKAEDELLLFIKAGWQLPAEYKIKELEQFAILKNIGIVSPKLLDNSGNIIYSGASRRGDEDMFYSESESLGYLKGVREISAPSSQFFIVRKELWVQAKGFLDLNISADYCLRDFCIKLEKLGYNHFYYGQISVYRKKKFQKEEPIGFLHMIEKWGMTWNEDSYFTRNMYRKMMNGHQSDFQMFLPQKKYDDIEKREKILFVSHEMSLTGAPIVLLYAARVLKGEGYYVMIISPKDGLLRQKFIEEQIPVIIDERMYKNSSWIVLIKEFDLIFLNTIVSFPCVLQFGKLNIPVVWWIHDAKAGYEKKLKNILPKKVKKNVDIYCVSEYARKVLLTYRPAYKVGLLPYGIPDLKNFFESAFQLKNDNDKKIFLIIGSLEKRKGQDILLQAIEKLKEESRQKSIFYFIGEPKDIYFLKKIEEIQQKYPETIQWIACLDRNDIMNAIRQAEAVICSSRDDPLPVFMTETMMMEGVCICSENTGTAAVIRSGVNGLLYYNNSSTELANCITYVLEHSKDMKVIRQEARKTYESEFALPIFKNNLLEIINKNIKKDKDF